MACSFSQSQNRAVGKQQVCLSSDIQVEMASRGNVETDKLKANVQEQLQRLLTQLEDLEAMRADLDDDEYEETRRETKQQLEEFEASLQKMMDGNMTLVDELGSVQLAIQAAIRDAFKTPDVIRMFANKEPDALRGRLAELESSLRLGKLSSEEFRHQGIEIVTVLQRLGCELTPREQEILNSQSTGLAAFAAASSTVGSHGEESLLKAAGAAVHEASHK